MFAPINIAINPIKMARFPVPKFVTSEQRGLTW